MYNDSKSFRTSKNTYKKKRDLNKLQISYSDAEIIKAVDQKNGFIFKWGNDYVIPQQWVGLISCKDFSIEILHKYLI